MNNALWKYIGISVIVAHSSVLLTFIARLYPEIAFILFILSLVAMIVLIKFYPDFQDENLWVKGLLAGIALLGLMVGSWDFILDYFTYHQSEVKTTITLFGGVMFLGGVYAWNQRTGNSKDS